MSVVNPGCMGNWKDLYHVTTGDKGIDFPWSALSDGVAMVQLPKTLATKIPFWDYISNKEWVCLVDCRLFLYEHDGEYRLYTLPPKE